jgi:hypothetical protein
MLHWGDAMTPFIYIVVVFLVAVPAIRARHSHQRLVCERCGKESLPSTSSGSRIVP